jgi:hypothetical protein
LLAEQVEHNQRLADDPDTFAVFVALDLQAWELVRFTLSTSAPDSARGAERYEVLYLARSKIASA